MPDLYAPAGRDFVDRCHSNSLCKFVCKFCAIGCVLWRFLVVLCGVLRLFLRHKTSNFSDFIVLNQNGTLIYLVYLIFSSGADLKHAIGTKVPVRTKAKLKLAATEHMTKLEKSPERVKSFFQDPRVKYAA